MAKSSKGGPFMALINIHLQGVEFAVQRGDTPTAMSHQAALSEILKVKLPPQPYYNTKQMFIPNTPAHFAQINWINGNRPAIARGVRAYVDQFIQNELTVETPDGGEE